MRYTTPEAVGVSSSAITAFIRLLEEHRIPIGACGDFKSPANYRTPDVFTRA